MSAEFLFRNRLNMCRGVGKIHCHHLDHGRLARNGPEVAAIGRNAKKRQKIHISGTNYPSDTADPSKSMGELNYGEYTPKLINIIAQKGLKSTLFAQNCQILPKF